VTAIVLGFGLWETVVAWQRASAVGQVGGDPDMYLQATQRWLAGSSFYLPEYVAAPYVLTGDAILYPPTTRLLFTPFLILPAALFWSVPMLVVGWVVVRHHPTAWAWPLIAECLVYIGGLGLSDRCVLAPSVASIRSMTLSRLWTFLAVALPALAAIVASMSTIDLTYQLRAGSEILTNRAIPTVDTWTFTVQGQPWFDQQWGAQVLLSTVFDGLGWTGLVLLRAVLVGLTFGCVFVIARRAGLSARNASLLILVSFGVAAPALALRPQLVGLALFALLLLVLAIRVDRPRIVWVIPFIVLIWANVHGSFVLGPLAVGLAWLVDLRELRESRFELAAVAGVSAIAACITPFGPSVWRYAIGLTADPSITGRISEWQRTLPVDVQGLLFYASLIAVVALVFRRRQDVAWPTVLWLSAFAVIGVYAVRGIAWWALAVVPPVALLASGLTSSPAEPLGTPTMQRANAVIVALLVLVGIGMLPIWRATDPGTGTPVGLLTDAPSGVTASLEQAVHQGDRVFNPQPWGSWFEFAIPDGLVAVDSRVEIFPATVWAAYDAVRAGTPGWEQILDGWHVALIAVEPNDDAMVARLVAAGWTILSNDASGAVLRRPA
jgi:hypothetical protein